MIPSSELLKMILTAERQDEAMPDGYDIANFPWPITETGSSAPIEHLKAAVDLITILSQDRSKGLYGLSSNFLKILESPNNLVIVSEDATKFSFTGSQMKPEGITINVPEDFNIAFPNDPDFSEPTFREQLTKIVNLMVDIDFSSLNLNSANAFTNKDDELRKGYLSELNRVFSEFFTS